jgi:hypothetical protein
MSLADLMGEEDHEHGYTEIQESEYTENRETDRSGSAVREEFRLPGDLAETLREYAHQQRLKKRRWSLKHSKNFSAIGISPCQNDKWRAKRLEACQTPQLDSRGSKICAGILPTLGFREMGKKPLAWRPYGHPLVLGAPTR